MNKLEQYVLRYQGIHSGTEEYLAADGRLHRNETDPSKGKMLFDGSQLGKKFPPYIQHVINLKRRAITLLDYGCGKAIHTYMPLSAHGNKTLLGRLNGMIQCYYAYDPAVKQYAMKPPLGMEFDVTCCADVMEHVPEEFVPVVLAEIGNYTKRNGTIIFSISSNPAKKMFKDGENLHATIRSIDWWVDAIKKYCGDRSFLLMHDDDKRLDSLSQEQKQELIQSGVREVQLCSTWIYYYNAPRFEVWEKSMVEKSYYEKVRVEEVK
ncbi:hypothetical protein OAU13_00765 [bacterium]|nr:hypothetical protein [bacterium]